MPASATFSFTPADHVCRFTPSQTGGNFRGQLTSYDRVSRTDYTGPSFQGAPVGIYTPFLLGGATNPGGSGYVTGGQSFPLVSIPNYAPPVEGYFPMPFVAVGTDANGVACSTPFGVHCLVARAPFAFTSSPPTEPVVAGTEWSYALAHNYTAPGFNGGVDGAYDFQSVPGITYALAASAPAWLSLTAFDAQGNLNSNNYRVKGTPPAAGTYRFEVLCYVGGNVAPMTRLLLGSQLVTIRATAAAGPALAFTCPATANAVVGTPIGFAVTTNVAPGSLVLLPSGKPAWMSLVGSTLSGTPDAPGTFSVTLSATPAEGGAAVTQTVAFTVRAAPSGGPGGAGGLALTIPSQISQPPGLWILAVSANFELSACSLAAGAPSWLSVKPPDGESPLFRLYGIVPPVSANTAFPFTVIGTDAAGHTAQQAVAFSAYPAPVGPPPATVNYTAPLVVSAVAGQPFTYTMAATVSPGSPTYSAGGQGNGGVLPSWLSLSGGNQLNGTPPRAEDVVLNVFVTVSGNAFTFRLVIHVTSATPALLTGGAGSAPAKVGQGFARSLTATGGGARTFSVTGLPGNGIAFQVDTIAGVPLVAGPMVVGLRVDGSDGTADQASLVIDVADAAPAAPAAGGAASSAPGLPHYCEAVNRTTVEAPGFFTPLQTSANSMKRGTVPPVAIQFVRNGAPYRLPAGWSIAFDLKEELGYTRPPLARAFGLDFDPPAPDAADADLWYVGPLDLRGQRLDALLNVVQADGSVKSADSVPLIGEISLHPPDGGAPVAYSTFRQEMANLVDRGDEGAPLPDNPLYPPAGQVNAVVQAFFAGSLGGSKVGLAQLLQMDVGTAALATIPAATLTDAVGGAIFRLVYLPDEDGLAIYVGRGSAAAAAGSDTVPAADRPAGGGLTWFRKL